MPDQIIPGAKAVTEWYSRIHGVMAGCGEASLLVIEAIYSGNPPTIDEVTALIVQAIQNGWSNPYGVITPKGLQKLGHATGTDLTIGPGGTGALQTIDANLAAGKPTELLVTKAYNLGGNDKGVYGHYITIVGRNTDTGAYVVADPYQPAAVNGGFMHYTAQTLLNASPWATLTPSGVPTGGGGIGGGVSDLLSNFNPFQQFLDAFHTNAVDFAWRFGLIVGGMVLIVWGMALFFSHQEEEVGVAITGQAQNAADAVKTVAASGAGG